MATLCTGFHASCSHIAKKTGSTGSSSMDNAVVKSGMCVGWFCLNSNGYSGIRDDPPTPMTSFFFLIVVGRTTGAARSPAMRKRMDKANA